MAVVRNRPSHYNKASHRSIWSEIWDAFWDKPTMVCPKCNSGKIEYYDPFFFAPVRTLQGKRRLRCTSCLFVWRPSRKSKSIWEKLRLIS